MINIEKLSHETKLYALTCSLWAVDLSEPSFFEKMGDYKLILTNKEQNLGDLKPKFIKLLYQRCKTLQAKRTILELVSSLRKIMHPKASVELQTLLKNKNNYYQEEIRITVVNNYIRRFKFFYLQYFKDLHPQYNINTQKDLNTLAIWALFFLLV